MTTRVQLRHEIARIVEGSDFITSSVTATGTGSGTTADSATLLAADDTYIGRYLYIYQDAGGAGAAPEGEGKIVTDSALTNGVLTHAAFTAAAAAGDLYELHAMGFTVTEYNEVIAAAYRAARGRMWKEKVDETLMFSNLLNDGMIGTWTSSSAATYWSADGNSTLARESNLIWSDTYSAKLTTDGSNEGYITQSVTNYMAYAGETATLRKMVYTITASRVRIRLYDGVTYTYSGYHSGGGWEELEVSKALSANPTVFSAQVYVDSGTAVVVYLGRAELDCGRPEQGQDYIYEHTIPTGFAVINSVWREDSAQHNHYTYQLPDKHWDIVRLGTRKLVFRNWIPAPGYRMRIVGKQFPTEPTVDSSTIDLNEEYVKAYAISQLQMRRARTELDFNIARHWQNLAMSLLAIHTTHMGEGRVVETI